MTDGKNNKKLCYNSWVKFKMYVSHWSLNLYNSHRHEWGNLLQEWIIQEKKVYNATAQKYTSNYSA